MHAAASGICRNHRVRVSRQLPPFPKLSLVSGVSVFMNFVSKVARTGSRGRLLMSLVAVIGLFGSLCLPAQAASVQPLEIATKSGVQVFSAIRRIRPSARMKIMSSEM